MCIKRRAERVVEASGTHRGFCAPALGVWGEGFLREGWRGQDKERAERGCKRSHRQQQAPPTLPLPILWAFLSNAALHPITNRPASRQPAFSLPADRPPLAERGNWPATDEDESQCCVTRLQIICILFDWSLNIPQLHMSDLKQRQTRSTSLQI